VLLGAVITAYLPSLLLGAARRDGTPGWEFSLALDILACLHGDGTPGHRGLSASALAEALQVDPVQLESVLDTLLALDWVGRLDEAPARYVMLVNPAVTSIGPLADRLLLAASPRTARLQIQGLQASSKLAEVL